MKVHNVVTFLLIGLATATRPPYNGQHSSTSAKAQVGKAILVRIPLDADATPNQYYQTGSQDYHEPQSSPSREATHVTKHHRGSQAHGYGYESKLPEHNNEQYQEQQQQQQQQNAELATRPEIASYGHQSQGYGYGSSQSQSDNRQKLVFLVPEGNRESSGANSGYESQATYPTSTATVQNYGSRRPSEGQASGEVVYSKQLTSPATKYQEKKANYQSSNKEHHKVPLILITLKDDNKAAKATQQARRIQPGYGKSWQPMPSESTRSFVDQNKPNYESVSSQENHRANQETGNSQWRGEQPIRQESKEESSQIETNPWREQSRQTYNNQWQSQSATAGVQYEKPQRNQQTTDEGYDQWKRPQTPIAKPEFSAGFRSGQSDSALSSSERNRPHGDGYYGANDNLEQNYRQNNAETSHQQRRPVESDSGFTEQPNYEKRPTESSSAYGQQGPAAYQQQSSDSRYQQPNSNGRYLIQPGLEGRYPQSTGVETRYQQASGAHTRYPSSSGTELGYTQAPRSETSSAEPKYRQREERQQYPEQHSVNDRYPQSVTESRIPQESTDSPLKEQNREKIQQSEYVSNYGQQQATSNSRYPGGSAPRVYGSGYGGANAGVDDQEQPTTFANQQRQVWNNQPTTSNPNDETWTRPSTGNNQNSNWGQATSYNPRDEPNRANQGSYARKEVRSHGYAGHQSAGSRPEDSWETQASSERATKTRAEKTKGVVLLLLSNDDKDVYARRVMEGPENEESIASRPTNA